MSGQTLVGGLGLLCSRFNCFFFMVGLVAKDGFHTREELVEVVGCFAVSLDGFASTHRALPGLSDDVFSHCLCSRRRSDHTSF